MPRVPSSSSPETRDDMSETDGFDATPEQAELRASVRSLARREFAPTYLTRAQSTDFPWKALRSLSDLGLLHMLCPPEHGGPCLLYTSDAADEEDSVDLGGRRIIKK